MDPVIAFIDQHKARFVSELEEWVKIPAISSDPLHKEDMQRNAEHLAKAVREQSRSGRRRGARRCSPSG